MNKKILYTTIFGGYDKLVTPTLNNDWDLILSEVILKKLLL